MPINKETIIELQKNESLSQLNTALSSFNGIHPAVAIPAGVSLESIESLMPLRNSYRFGFSTKSIESFIEYNKEFDQLGAKCFVDSTQVTARTIFDLGTKEAPLHQLHTASIKLVKTAAYAALLEKDGDKLSQKQAAEFLEDWADNLTVYDSESQRIPLMTAAKRLREITIEQVRNAEFKVSDMSEKMSAFEQIEAKNAETIPAVFNFVCEPYHGLSKREFTMRLSIITGDDKPKIGLRIVRLEQQQEDIAEEFKDLLTERLDGADIKVLIGNA
jgi:uncharacterized protein YfdQ (DUF2303 family)